MRLARRTRRVLLIASTIYLLSVAGLAMFFPVDGRGFTASFGAWLLALPAGLALYAALDFFCTWALERPFWKAMPSWFRVLLLAALICAVLTGVLLLKHGLL